MTVLPHSLVPYITVILAASIHDDKKLTLIYTHRDATSSSTTSSITSSGSSSSSTSSSSGSSSSSSKKIIMGKSEVRRLLSRTPVVKDAGQNVLDVNIIFFLSLSLQAAGHASEDGVTCVNPDDYAFEKTLSFLVPRYVVLNDEQVQSMCAKKCITVSNLPVMLSTDAMARFVGLKKGMVVMAVDNGVHRLVV